MTNETETPRRSAVVTGSNRGIGRAVAEELARAGFGPLNYSKSYSWVSTGIVIAAAVSFLVYGLIYDSTG